MRLYQQLFSSFRSESTWKEWLDIKKTFTEVYNATRLALASVLGPFGVYWSTLQYISVHMGIVKQFIS